MNYSKLANEEVYFGALFKDYNIINYQSFNNDDNLKDANIAATLLKIQERKTAKGNSYGE